MSRTYLITYHEHRPLPESHLEALAIHPVDHLIFKKASAALCRQQNYGSAQLDRQKAGGRRGVKYGAGRRQGERGY